MRAEDAMKLRTLLYPLFSLAIVSTWSIACSSSKGSDEGAPSSGKKGSPTTGDDQEVVSGPAAKAEEQRCETAHFDRAEQCRGSDGKFADNACCLKNIACTKAKLDSRGVCRAEDGKF